jgi:hypothetical protein
VGVRHHLARPSGRGREAAIITTALKRRVGDLEAATGRDGGCERCRGLLITVSNVTTGEFHSARWNGEEVSEEEVRERQEEIRCPRCGRKLDPEDAPVIKVGGLR